MKFAENLGFNFCDIPHFLTEIHVQSPSYCATQESYEWKGQQKEHWIFFLDVHPHISLLQCS